MCSRCGAFSGARTHKLKEECRASPDDSARKRMDRFFEMNLHPTDAQFVDPPRLWHIGPARQDCDNDRWTPDCRKKVGRTSKTASNDSDWGRRFGSKAAGFKPFKFPEPDALEFKLAVLNATEADDRVRIELPTVPAEPTSSCVGVSTDGVDRLAEQINSGARIRGRFKFRGEPRRDNNSSDTPVSVPRVIDVIVELLDCIRDTGRCLH